MTLWNIPLDDERNLSIDQFCLAEDLERDQFDYLLKNGLAPHVSDLSFGLSHRITPKARREWHQRVTRELEKAEVENAVF